MNRSKSLAILIIALFAVPHRGHGGAAPELPPEIVAERAYNARQEASDRKELVASRGKRFRPDAKKSVEIRLTVEKATLRIGEPIRYRVEIVNLGAKPFEYLESPSFFKTGRLPHRRINLILKDPTGKTVNLESPISSGHGMDEMRFAEGTPESEKLAQFEDKRRTSEAQQRLFVVLHPGESLHTRGKNKGDKFRELVVRYKLDVAGAYELQAELDGLLKPGQLSNTVRIIVRE